MDEVLEFIKRRFKNDCKWLDGNCYYFSLILHDRFKSGDILYDVLDGHFLYKYNNKYYDWSGEVSAINYDYLVVWEDFDKYDHIQKQRIITDCIL